MTDVYLPLPYTPKNLDKEPRVLFKLGSTFQRLEVGQKLALTNTVFPTIYFSVMVTGFYREFVLVQPQDNNIRQMAKRRFFSSNLKEDYRPLSEDEYCSLYPEERRLLPERVINLQELY